MSAGPMIGMKKGLPPDPSDEKVLEETGLSKEEMDNFFKDLASEEFRRIMDRLDELEEKIDKILQGD